MLLELAIKELNHREVMRGACKLGKSHLKELAA